MDNSNLLRSIIKDKDKTIDKLQDTIEAQQESLQTILLQWLSNWNTQSYKVLDNQMNVRGFALSVGDLESMIIKGLIDRNSFGYFVTEAGRDYLASLQVQS